MEHFPENVKSSILNVRIWCLQALLNNSYFYHLAHGKDFESRGIESKKPCLFFFEDICSFHDLMVSSGSGSCAAEKKIHFSFIIFVE